MNDPLPESLLSDISERIARQMGLYFPRERWRELEAGLRAAASGSGVENVASWVRGLAGAPLRAEQVELLAQQLTIGETYFLRERPSFTLIGEHILPQLIRARRNGSKRLRIWSAGCSTGEEPFSLAILLDRLLPDFSAWSVTILATDINRRFLEHAAAGIYSEWSFRDAPRWLRERYFQPAGKGRLALLPRIRERVTFGYLNLAEDPYPSLNNNTNAMDLIFCRNVLMYFKPELVQHIADSFFRALLEGGWLVVSAVESSSQLFQQFKAVYRDGAILYQKRASAAVPQAAAADRIAPWAPTMPTRIGGDSAPRRASAVAAEPPPAAAPDILKHSLELYQAGQYTQAAQCLARNPPAAPVSTERCMLEARIRANLGELGEARRWAEQAIAADKIDPAAHYLHALILQEEGRIDEAVSALKRTLFLASDFLLAHFALGGIARQQGREAEARRQFASVLALLEGHPDSEVLPHADGLLAGRLKQLVQSMAPLDGNA